jgi:fucose 4-O-acetylase-like acetyltransferase
MSVPTEKVPVRQYWIDALKAISIGLIVFYHECGHYFPATVRYLSSIPVPVFVFLAGYQLSKRALLASPTEFFSRNCWRIVVVFLSLGLLTYLPWWLKNQFVVGESYANTGPWLPLFGLLYGASGPQEWITHNVPLWFLSFLVSVLFCYYSLFRISKTPQNAFAASLVLFAAGTLLVSKLPVRLPWNFDLALVGLPFFALGYLAKTYRLDLTFARPRVAMTVLPILLVVNFLAEPHSDHIDLNVGMIGNPLLLLIDGVSGVLLAMAIAVHLPRFRLLEIVGRDALIIFALQSLTNVIFEFLLAALMGEAAGPAHGTLPVVAAVVAFNCTACILLAIPIRRYLPWVLGGRTRRKLTPARELRTA